MHQIFLDAYIAAIPENMTELIKQTYSGDGGGSANYRLHEKRDLGQSIEDLYPGCSIQMPSLSPGNLSLS